MSMINIEINWKRFWRCVKDVFKPRYALQVELLRLESPAGLNEPYQTHAAINSVPCKRKFSTPFNVFYNQLQAEASRKGGFIFCGSYFTLWSLYGIGSTNWVNMKNSYYFNEKVDIIEVIRG